VLTGTALVIGVLATVHLTLGTSAVGPADVWHVALRRGTDQQAAVVMLSRVPRLAAAVLVGVALGVAGAVLQTVARNPLASPDTLAVEAGAYLALTAVAAFALDVPVVAGAGVALLGGLASAGLVLGVSRGGSRSTIRLVLAGTVVALGLSSLTSALLLFFAQETRGLYAWGAGSLGQRDLDGIQSMAPVVAGGVVAVLLLARQLDVLELGDDTARSLGLHVGRTRVALVGLAVLLSAAAVTVAGPIGFVGLCAPALVRIAVPWVPPFARAGWRVAASALAAVAILLAADVAVRVVFGPLSGVEVPTGVVTTVVGGVFLVALAQRVRTATDLSAQEHARTRVPWGRSHFVLHTLTLGLLVGAVTVAALLSGDTPLLLGDLAHYATGVASDRIELILDARIPRVVAAALAGAALAVAGALVQGVTRNSLADPGILGVAAGAGFGAILVLTFLPTAGFAAILAGAMATAGLAAGAVLGLSARDAMDPTRLVLVGIGVAATAAALTALVIVRSDPWNQAKAIMWLGGSTYGAQLAHQVPLAVALVAATLVLVPLARDLDLLQLDEATPRLLGVRVGRSRLLLLGTAVGLTATATASIGVIAFVGLVAPHAARLLVGRVHQRLLPTAALLGALLVVVADAAGRTALAPNQLPAGLVTALLGAPYFVWLMRRAQVHG
jgi:iron complex transport system permease protein